MRKLFLFAFMLGCNHSPALHLVSQPSHRLVETPISVFAHVSTNLTEQEVKEFLRIGSEVLQRVDSDQDVATNLRLTLNGQLQHFTEGKGEIANCSELEAIFKLPGDVHVVRTINCCKGIQTPVLGCSRAGQGMILFSDVDHAWTRDAKGVLWAHEYGHKKGLLHRNEGGAIMAKVIAETHNSVTPCERDHYLGVSNLPCQAIVASTVTPHLDVKTFVRQVFIEGIPYEEGASYASSDLSTLTSMLNDCADKLYWPNIVNLLGMIGDIRAFKILKDFLESDSVAKCGPIPHFSYLGKEAVPVALGYILAKNNDPEILKYLGEGLNPRAWPTRLHWSDSSSQAQLERNAHLTHMSILGLALSGQSGARELLVKLHATSSVRSMAVTEFEAGIEPLVDEALSINAYVGTNGLAQYYRVNSMK